MKFKAHRTFSPKLTASALLPHQVARTLNVPLGMDLSKFTIGIVELGGALNILTFNAWCTQHGYPVPKVTQITVDGDVIISDPQGADGEVALDCCVIAGIAQGANQLICYGQNSDQGFEDAFSQLISQKVDVISCSWGGPFDSFDPATVKKMDSIFQQAKAAGIPVFCAAGDNGSSDGVGDGKPHTDYPACSPYVVSCGGTRLELNSDGTRGSEVVWLYDPSTSEGTGGGICTSYPTPDYQKGLLPSMPAGRRSPDIAANADPATGYQIEVNGLLQQIGGTSAASPAGAAIHVCIKAKTGKSVDWNSLPYTNSVCYDVTEGTNGAYNAGPGYDLCTGNGTPDGQKIIAALTGINLPPPVPTPTPTLTWWQKLLSFFGL